MSFESQADLDAFRAFSLKKLEKEIEKERDSPNFKEKHGDEEGFITYKEFRMALEKERLNKYIVKENKDCLKIVPVKEHDSPMEISTPFTPKSEISNQNLVFKKPSENFFEFEDVDDDIRKLKEKQKNLKEQIKEKKAKEKSEKKEREREKKKNKKEILKIEAEFGIGFFEKDERDYVSDEDGKRPSQKIGNFNILKYLESEKGRKDVKNQKKINNSDDFNFQDEIIYKKEPKEEPEKLTSSSQEEKDDFQKYLSDRDFYLMYKNEYFSIGESLIQLENELLNRIKTLQEMEEIPKKKQTEEDVEDKNYLKKKIAELEKEIKSLKSAKERIDKLSKEELEVLGMCDWCNSIRKDHPEWIHQMHCFCDKLMNEKIEADFSIHKEKLEAYKKDIIKFGSDEDRKKLEDFLKDGYDEDIENLFNEMHGRYDKYYESKYGTTVSEIQFNKEKELKEKLLKKKELTEKEKRILSIITADETKAKKKFYIANRCDAILVSGSKKGEQCGIVCGTDEKCGIHSATKESIKNPCKAIIQKKGRIGEECGNKCVKDSIYCVRHKNYTENKDLVVGMCEIVNKSGVNKGKKCTCKAKVKVNDKFYCGRHLRQKNGESSDDDSEQ